MDSQWWKVSRSVSVKQGIRLALLVGLLQAGCAGKAVETNPINEPEPAQPSEAAVATSNAVIPAMTPSAEAKLKAAVDAVLVGHDSQIPVSSRASVLKMIHHLQHHPDARKLVEAALHQAPLYNAKISSLLERDGLPPELFYIAAAESAFLSPDLQGKGLAVGLWQMIPSTARHYGLQVNEGVDERKDVFKSTDASLRHLVDLHATFGDWELVITGFYAGAGIVERGLEMSGATDAWSLIESPGALPEETRGYLPLVYAHLIVALDPVRFGFSSNVSDEALEGLKTNFGHYYTHRYPMDLFAP